ncbi:efflux RND transporter periplasmic adaptor subunit [Marinicauda algicola]|uniref:Efflux RND transporter periplasmic adaptor subunit n=1 Tax=Marinicauda algicola TaxID=2029849 RepID=A0A4S2H4Q2_9PROT|nr:efflux RND transporter periplasmic adaptor subunit [Marinicauda algicola]TGY90408.1 efflux RND transporter periplasmic adaptor subunit [Marinicauda algicola]
MSARLLPLAPILLLIAACSGQTAETDAPLKAAKIEAVMPADAPSRREFVGRVEARLTVDLAFQVPGRLADFPVSEGEIVPEGTLIARLETQDFERALREAQVQLQQAEQNLERVRTLHERGITADAALEEARTAYDLRAVALDMARQNLDYATMTAPFEGLVSRRLVDNFSTVAAGQPIARLQDLSELRVAISVPESLIATLDREAEREVVARFPFLPEQSFPLEYRELIAEPDQASQTYTVLLALPDDVPANILPGMTATVEVRLDEAADEDAGVLIPVSALTTTPQGSFEAWVYDPVSGAVSARPVVTGPVSGDLILVRSGLEAGELIVTAGVNALHEGMKVRPLASQASLAAGGR